MLASFVLAAAALGTGQLATVQLIVILELPLTLVGSALFLGGHVPTRDWAAIMVMSAGVIGLLVLLDPEPGTGEPASAVIWVAGSAANVAVIVGLYIAARARRQPAVRSALLGIAVLGLRADGPFTKGMASLYATQGRGVLSSWQIYAHAAGLVSTRRAERVSRGNTRGRSARHYPGRSCSCDLRGAAAFGEHVRHGWLRWRRYR
jgi:drug/metabolite transporter (DMT)-like permease